MSRERWKPEPCSQRSARTGVNSGCNGSGAGATGPFPTVFGLARILDPGIVLAVGREVSVDRIRGGAAARLPALDERAVGRVVAHNAPRVHGVARRGKPSLEVMERIAAPKAAGQVQDAMTAFLCPPPGEMDEQLRRAVAHEGVERAGEVVFDDAVDLGEHPRCREDAVPLDDAEMDAVPQRLSQVREVLARKAPEGARPEAIHRLLICIHEAVEPLP